MTFSTSNFLQFLQAADFCRLYSICLRLYDAYSPLNLQQLLADHGDSLMLILGVIVLIVVVDVVDVIQHIQLHLVTRFVVVATYYLVDVL